MLAATAAVLPGADADDNGGIHVSSIVETTDADDGPIMLDLDTIRAMSGTDRLGINVAANPADRFDDLVVDPAGS